MLVWQAHKGRIGSIAFHPEGTVLATATGGTSSVYLWNPTTGKPVRKLAAGASVASVAFAPAAPLLAASAEARIYIWNTDTWELVAILVCLRAYELAFSSGSNPTLAAVRYGNVEVWADASKTTERWRDSDRTFGTGDGSASLAFSPDGATLAANNPNGPVSLWNPVTREKLRAFEHPKSNHHGPVKFSPDGTRLAYAHHKFVVVRSLTDNTTPPLEFTAGAGSSPAVWAIGWSRDGRVLLTAGSDGSARLWDSATGGALKSFAWNIGKVKCATFSPDGLLAAAGGENGQVVVWDVDG